MIEYDLIITSTKTEKQFKDKHANKKFKTTTKKRSPHTVSVGDAAEANILFELEEGEVLSQSVIDASSCCHEVAGGMLPGTEGLRYWK